MLKINTVIVRENTKEAVINALVELSDLDADFTGDNGDEYLWNKAKAKGFENNRDYVLNEIKDDNKVSMIDNFFRLWLGNDNYYKDYDYNILLDKESKNIVVISLSFVTETE